MCPPAAAGVSACGGGSATSSTTEPTALLASVDTAARGAMRNLTSTELSKLMSPGINLGNTLEAMPNETAWGNPVPTQSLMNAYKAAGFKTVRIPVSWSQYADANNNRSESTRLNSSHHEQSRMPSSA